MIDLFLKYAADPSIGPELSGAIANLTGSAGQGNAGLVELAELAVCAAPAKAFSFDADGFATLRVGEHSWHAGRFETPSIAELRRAPGRQGLPAGSSACGCSMEPARRPTWAACRRRRRLGRCFRPHRNSTVSSRRGLT